MKPVETPDALKRMIGRLYVSGQITNGNKPLPIVPKNDGRSWERMLSYIGWIVVGVGIVILAYVRYCAG